MSLINQMLQDLEKRNGGTVSVSPLPSGVHSSLPKVQSRRGLWVGLVLAGALIGGGGVYLLKWVQQPADVLPPVSVTDIPATLPAPPAEEKPVEAPKEASTDAAPATPAPAPVVAANTAVATPVNTPATPSEKATVAPDAEAKPATKAAPAPVPSAAPVQAKEPVAKPPAKGVAVRVVAADTTTERAEAHYRDALNAFNQGRSAELQQAARQALQVMPGHIGARQLLIRHLMEQRATEPARQELRDGLLQHPNQMLWSTLLVRLELDRNDLVAARQVVDQALPHAANQADFQSLAGAVAQRQGKPAEAAGFYRAALQLKPADGRSWVGLGMSLEADGHVPEAKEAFRRALATESLSPDLKALAERKIR